MKAKGAEPDDSFYIQNAARVIGNPDLDLGHDPPPDLVVEIDRTSASLNKFTIYAALGVPEIWRLSGPEVQIYLFGGDGYDLSPMSRAFLFLSAETLSEFIARGIAEGERKCARAFRAWIQNRNG